MVARGLPLRPGVRAVKTARSNFVFNPPRGGQGWCDPVWVERTTISIGDGDRLPCLKLAFELDAADLVRLNAGARLELTVVGEGMPPVALAAGVVDGPPAALAIADVT